MAPIMISLWGDGFVVSAQHVLFAHIPDDNPKAVRIAFVGGVYYTMNHDSEARAKDTLRKLTEVISGR